MTPRELSVQQFIRDAGWGAAQVSPLAGDASSRTYFRLNVEGKTAVLMDADPELGEETGPFLSISSFLTAHGLSAPEILAADQKRGLLLLEDLGDNLFARILSRRPELEDDLYKAAAGVLVGLRQLSLPDVAEPDASALAQMTEVAETWYANRQKSRFSFELEPVLADLPPDRTLALRDYHSENLIWLPDRSGVRRVGLLDYQDAMIAHPAYDLVSLLQDARRDLGPEVAENTLKYYIDQTGEDEAAFRHAFAVLGVQRNLRILGVFARLSLKFGKPSYVDLIPRVWAHLLDNLEHPQLQNLRQLVLEALPPPTEDHLDRLRS